MTSLHHVIPDSNATTVAAPELPADFAAQYPILSVHWPNLFPEAGAHAAHLAERDRHPEQERGARAA